MIALDRLLAIAARLESHTDVVHGCKDCRSIGTEVEAALSDVKEAWEEAVPRPAVERLAAAAHHSIQCEWVTGGSAYECTCGLDEALREYGLTEER